MNHDMNTNKPTVPPLPLWGSALLFGIPTLLMWFATRHAIPVLQERLAGPDILCWFVAGGAVFLCLFIGAFVGFRIEEQRVSLVGFTQRFRLAPIQRADVLWSLGTLVVCGLLSAAIAGVWTWASNPFPFLGKPDLSPTFMPVEPLTHETLWVLLAWLPLFFFNIAGEELWWRGYMLPRQEQSHGNSAWIVHGIGLAVFHLPLGIPLTIIALPILFGLPFVVQRRRNLWTGIIVHGIFNGLGFLAVAFGVV
jgi:membrane protease YdiL (CAAX protease family)